MRTNWESSQPWLSESIVTHTSVKPHASAGCWREEIQATSGWSSGGSLGQLPPQTL